MQTGDNAEFSCTKSYDAFGNVASTTCSWIGDGDYAGAFGHLREPDAGVVREGPPAAWQPRRKSRFFTGSW